MRLLCPFGVGVTPTYMGWLQGNTLLGDKPVLERLTQRYGVIKSKRVPASSTRRCRFPVLFALVFADLNADG